MVTAAMPATIASRALAHGRWLVAGWLVGLLAWVLVPALVLGWAPTVVTSGSMEPRIRPGDVVLVDPGAPPAEVGAVVQFRDDADVLVLHRVARVHTDGSLQTRGDANLRPDASVVPPERVVGRGVLLVPYAAHPVSLAGLAGLLVAAVVRRPRSGGRGRTTRGGWTVRRVLVAGAALAVTAAAGTGGLVSRAAFTDVTSTSGSQVRVLSVAPPATLAGECSILGLGSGQAALAWAASTTPGISHYEILHGVGAPPSTVVATVPATATSTTHTLDAQLLSLGNQHAYAVRAVHGGFTSPPSPVATITITQVLGLLYVCG